VLRELAEGRADETPQDESQVTYADKITKAEGAIQWSLPAERIHNLVRGLQPWPLVSCRIGGNRVIVHRTARTTAVSPDRPGTIVRADADRLEVVAGDGHVLQLVVLQPEGRRAMSAREFLAGRHVPPGTKVEQG
jgi:methionyl-tRNA formyltransferase